MNLRKWSYLFLLSLLLIGCGNKEIVGTEKVLAQPRSVSAFNQVNVSGYYNINITIGSPQSVVVKVNGNLLPYIETSVKGKTLTIQSKKGYLLRPQGVPEIDIVSPSVSKIELSGKNRLDLHNFQGTDLEINLSGSNQFSAKGAVSSFSMALSGNSSIDAQQLIANKVAIDSNGNSKILINAKDKLTVSISGNSLISYLGNPKIKQTINGSGAIAKMQETVTK
jgi:Putative auto-transporter adhesin, head GIN domain